MTTAPPVYFDAAYSTASAYAYSSPGPTYGLNVQANGVGYVGSECLTNLGGDITGSKGYWEVKINTLSDSRIGWKVGAHTYEWEYLGHLWLDTSTDLGVAATYTSIDVLGFAIDGTTGDYQLFKNGSLVKSGTAAYVGFQPRVYLRNTAGNREVVGRFTLASFGYTPPAGYAALEVLASPFGPHAVGAVSMELVTAVGYRISAGVGTLSAVTAAGGRNAWGDSTLQQLTATAAGGSRNGTGVMSAVTAAATGYSAPGGSATMEVLTALGTGLAGSFGAGASILQAVDATASGSQPNGGAAAVTLQQLTASAYGGHGTVIVMEQLAASATGLAGTIGSAVGRMQALSALSTGTVLGRGNGSAAAQQLSALATGRGLGGSGAATAQRVLAAATGLAGGKGSGAVSPEVLEALATGFTPTHGAGAAYAQQLAMYAGGSSALSSNMRVWAVNVGNDEVTEYTNFNYNSFAQFGGKYWAAGSAGLFSLEGQTDDGVAIPWSFKTSAMDGGKASLKHLSEVLLALRYNGSLTVRVWVNKDTYYDYSLPNYRADVLEQVRVQLGRGLRSRFFQIEVIGAGDTDAQISNMNLPMVPVSRRIG